MGDRFWYHVFFYFILDVYKKTKNLYQRKPQSRGRCFSQDATHHLPLVPLAVSASYTAKQSVWITGRNGASSQQFWKYSGSVE